VSQLEGNFMTLGNLFAGMTTHHVALRVPDATASKNWFVDKLDFRVHGEFVAMGIDFVWLSPADNKIPMIEVMGGGTLPSRPAIEGPADYIKQPSFHHVCLQVDDLDLVVAELKRRNVKIVVDVMAGLIEKGIEKVAFIADPWDNAFELLQLTSDSKP
jgi:lactoylglutathione lyase/glyoxylase I family protein